MNKKILLLSFVKIIIIISLTLVINFIIQSRFGTIILKDQPSIGFYWGALGTIYALIAAFILVTVWGQYNDFQAIIAKEAKALSALWNYTDYLNDKKISVSMQRALLNYIDVALEHEFPRAAKANRVVHPSKELVAIMKVIDQIKYDDPRDESAFKALIQTYEELSAIRSERIEQSITRIPPLMNCFYQLVSGIFILVYITHGFHSFFLQSLTLGLLTLIVVFIYVIIMDLDNPFEGIWNINLDSLQNCRNYILRAKHRR